MKISDEHRQYLKKIKAIVEGNLCPNSYTGVILVLWELLAAISWILFN